uniref:Arginine vasopressin-induced protein 1 n=1 Tax=Paramormyrops kingsleyae TaxID=1676925 RepID=A0A3B3T5A5_9TELE
MEDPPPPSAVVAPPEPWQLPECRRRRCGSANIFHGLGLRQLQRLFHRSGDHNAEHRAQLVWRRSDGEELARALIGLRTGSRRGCPRGPIGEVSPDSTEENTEVHLDSSESDGPGTSESAGNRWTDTEQPQSTPICDVRVRHRMPREGGQDRNPERYLHRVLQRPGRAAQGRASDGSAKVDTSQIS